MAAARAAPPPCAATAFPANNRGVNPSSPFLRPLAPWLGIDPRALAFLRIGLACFVGYDLAGRLPSLAAHYTDQGVLPRPDLLQAFGWLHEWPLCLHLMTGSTLGQALLFGVHGLAALALLVGYRTRLACFVVWWLTASLQWRNLYLGGGFDGLLRMLLFWGMFLPLGARAAVDASDEPRRRDERYVSIAGMALLLQIAWVYFGAGWAKWQTGAWEQGEALGLIFADDYFVTGVGRWLGSLPTLCRWGGYAVLIAELLGPPALLLCGGPLAGLRLPLVVAFWLMNLGFAVALAVGPFPELAALALVVFLPPAVWDALERVATARGVRVRLEAWRQRLRGMLPPAGARRRSPWWVGETVALACALWVMVWNVGLLRDPEFMMPTAARWFGHGLFLQQNWRMFAMPPSRTGWMVIPGRLVDGSEVDLLAAGGPVPGDEAIRTVAWERPDDLLGRADGLRWRVLLHRLLKGDNQENAPLNYGRYLCRSWNQAHADGRQLATFEIVAVVADLVPGESKRRYLPETIWRHDCFG